MAPSAEDVRNGRKAKLAITEPGLLETAQRFWQKSYAGDYIGLIVIAAIELWLKLFAEPFHQMFVIDDFRISHPWAAVERVDVFWLLVLGAGVPLLVIMIWTLMLHPNTHKAHVTILGLAISVLYTSFFTDIIKDAIGRPRPDLVDRCSPDPSAPRHELVTIDVCTETYHHKLHDGFRSFPSGHSSFSFAGLGWLALFFASQTHVFQPPRKSLMTVLFCFAPLLGAAMIAISRLEDYRHDVGDVTIGSIIGITITSLNWRRYYPSLLSKHCDEPYGPPSGTSRRSSSTSGYHRAMDEEEAFAGAESDRLDLGDEGNGGGGRSGRQGSR